MGSLVLATDFSRASVVALRVAADLATRLGDRVVLVHALGHGGHAPGSAGEEAGVPYLHDGSHLDHASVMAWLERWAEALRADGVEAVADARVGDAHEVIQRAVEEHGAQHVVLGRQGLGRMQRILTGSVTRAVLAHSTVPVTVVPVR